MKKFVQIDGYGDQWFWLIESVDDVDPEAQRLARERIYGTVRSQMYTDPSKSEIRQDWLQRIQAVRMFPIDYGEMVEKYGPILVRYIGSWMTLNDPKDITNSIFSETFPGDSNSADIVVCENDYDPEPFWIEHLQAAFPGKTIRVLNLFGGRGDTLDIDLDVLHITFSTTFTSYDWFESILDTIIRNNWTGVQIIGYCGDPTKWNFPDYIQEKMNIVLGTGNQLEIVKDINIYPLD